MKRQLQVFNFSVQNAANDAVDIHIDSDIVDAETQGIMKAFYGDETSTSFKSFRQQISSNPAKTYNVIINSNGGHLGDALAMHDWILQKRSEGTTINTKGIGIVASAGTYVLMAGEKPEMTKNSWFLIHNVSGGIYGDVNEVENYAKSLRKFNDNSRDYYASYTGKRPEEVTKMMNAGQFLTAQEAKDHGFIKEVTPEVKFTQAIPKDQWQYSDMKVLNAYNSNVETPPASPDNDKSFFQNQFDDMKKIFTDVINSIKGIKPADNSDKQEILNKVAEAMKPLETLESEIDTSITNKVDEALKGEAVTNAINAAVTAAIAPLNTKIGELETEIANSKGKPSVTNTDKDAPKPIGKFS